MNPKSTIVTRLVLRHESTRDKNERKQIAQVLANLALHGSREADQAVHVIAMK